MHKTIGGVALWSQKTFPKNSLILTVEESKFHLKLNNRKYCGQVLYSYYKEKLNKERNNISIVNEIMPEKYVLKTPKICNLRESMKRARNSKDVGKY